MSAWLDRDFVPDLVSLVIPVWNGENTLPETLDSVLAQTYRQIETVVVDDGSSDGTLPLLAGYKGRFSDSGRNLSILKQLSAGPAAARNLGMCKATGEFLCYLDSDDLLCAEKLRLQVAYMRRHPRADAVHCYSDFFRDSDGRVVSNAHGTYDPEDPLAFLLQKIRTLNTHCTFLWRREILRHLGPMDETVAQREDWLYLVRFLATRPELGCIRRILCRIRLREDSLTSRRDSGYYDAIAASLEKAREILIEEGLDRYLPFLADLAFIDGVSLLDAGETAALARICAVLSDIRLRERLPRSLRLAVGKKGFFRPLVRATDWFVRRRRFRNHLAALRPESPAEEVEGA